MKQHNADNGLKCKEMEMDYRDKVTVMRACFQVACSLFLPINLQALSKNKRNSLAKHVDTLTSQCLVI